jgi:hypothetical protein
MIVSKHPQNQSERLKAHAPCAIFGIGLIALSLVGCGERWEGFVYPDKNNLANHLSIGEYSSLENCRDAARSALKDISSITSGDYECGLNCSDGASQKICEKTGR